MKESKIKEISIKDIITVFIGLIICYIPTILSYWASSRNLINHEFEFVDKTVTMEWFIYDLTQHGEIFFLRLFITFLIYRWINYTPLTLIGIVYILDTCYDILNYIITYQTFSSLPTNVLIFGVFVYAILKIMCKYVQEIT